jgi:hypothetical protein
MLFASRAARPALAIHTCPTGVTATGVALASPVGPAVQAAQGDIAEESSPVRVAVASSRGEIETAVTRTIGQTAEDLFVSLFAAVTSPANLAEALAQGTGAMT